MPKYNVAFTIAFSVPHCSDEKGKEVTARQFRNALLERLASLDDGELTEAIGLGWDAYEEEE